MEKSGKNKRDIGKEGEEIAADFLIKKDFKILAKNYQYGHGEIDIVADDKGVLVFVEVKTRLNLEFGEPEYAITPKKIKQIKKIAELYLFDKEIEEANCRFDVVAILLEDESNPKIMHYVNAFL
ncbi:MAG: YraN family protein [Ignavibacteriaceae bacterium]